MQRNNKRKLPTEFNNSVNENNRQQQTAPLEIEQQLSDLRKYSQQQVILRLQAEQQLSALQKSAKEQFSKQLQMKQEITVLKKQVQQLTKQIQPEKIGYLPQPQLIQPQQIKRRKFTAKEIGYSSQPQLVQPHQIKQPLIEKNGQKLSNSQSLQQGLFSASANQLNDQTKVPLRTPGKKLIVEIPESPTLDDGKSVQEYLEENLKADFSIKR